MQQSSNSSTAEVQVIENDISLESLKNSGKRWVAKLKGVATPEEAARFTNFLLGVQRDTLPPSNPTGSSDYYWYDLMGARVISLYAGREIMLGTIVNMQRCPANDNMVVKGEQGKHHYIPFLCPDYVTEVQLQSPDPLTPPTIKVNWDPDF